MRNLNLSKNSFPISEKDGIDFRNVHFGNGCFATANIIRFSIKDSLLTRICSIPHSSFLISHF